MTHGGIETHGSAYEVLKMTPEAAEEMLNSQLETLDQTKATKSTPGSPGVKEEKLVIAEEVALGHVSRNACKPSAELCPRKRSNLTYYLRRQAFTWEHGIEGSACSRILDSISRRCGTGGGLQCLGIVVARLLDEQIYATGPCRRSGDIVSLHLHKL